tara:strand:+ start:89460 stop:90035 length:576 start_codon:yes stop_codon:yes gene_type:complete
MQHVEKKRCSWVSDLPLYQDYHDTEWGVPVHDDNVLFEFLILEGAQAGLSWITVLKKREAYREHFANFDPEKVAQFSDRTLESMLHNPAFIRNRLKIFGARKNAQAFLKVQEKFGSFNDYIWQFVDGEPQQNDYKQSEDAPATTAISNAMAKDLKKRGFTFVGSTICYAFMQAVGMVNDHAVDCFRHAELS